MQLTIILSTHKAPRALEAVLKKLTQQTDSNFEVVIAEDGQDAATAQVIQTYQSVLKLIHVTQDHTRMRKCLILNKAIRNSSGTYVVFLDGDCVPHKRFVADHKALAEEHYFVQGRRTFIKEIAVDTFIKNNTIFAYMWLVLTGKVVSALKGVWLPLPIVKKDTALDKIVGCNLGVYRKDLEAVNGFDEDFEGWGLEDSDMAIRLYRLGNKRKLVYGRALVYHLNHPKLLPNTDNKALFETSVASGRTVCNNGLKKL
jgi:glycosyltransferase involved in cell wall biosynthesis